MPKPAKIKDPHAEREKSRYQKPIPSREYILEYLEQRGTPAAHGDLCGALQLLDEEGQEALRRRLKAMCRDGQLITNRRGLFGLIDRMDLVKARVVGNKDGFGFAVPEDGSDDLYLSPRQMQQVFDGDTVIVRLARVDRRGRREGRIVEVLERKSTRFVGRYYKEAGAGVVIPVNKRISQEILVAKKHRKKAEDGSFVVVEVTSFPRGHHKAQGKVVEVLGNISTPGLEIEVALRSHDIPHEWPAEVAKQLSSIPTALGQQADAGERVDYRGLPFVTIDGEDARDFDDAVFCRKRRDSWELHVAIADVSHYVAAGTALDQEAHRRGTSVYFPGHVVPMLPPLLSDDLCSLLPGADRLAMVCKIRIGQNGEMRDYQFSEGIIHSQARLTYVETAALLQKPATPAEQNLQARLRRKHGKLLPHLKELQALCKALRQAREQRGALDFASVETRIVFSEQRKIQEILPIERNEAHRLVEECMLCANVAAAKLLLEAKLPTLYRVHAGPDEEKVDRLYGFLRAMGIGLAKRAKPTTTDFQNILKRLARRADRRLLEAIVMRSLKQAAYQPENIGHFGLGYEAYAHFTSPIRRYPDLLVHRAIRCLLRRGKAEGLPEKRRYPYDAKQLRTMGAHLSSCERRADAASYDVIDWLKCEYILQHIDAEFAGTVTSVTAFGLFVELEDLYIEGLVHVTALRNDYYHFDPVAQRLTGERSGQSFQLGDRVRVKVSHVVVDERKIDLSLLERIAA